MPGVQGGDWNQSRFKLLSRSNIILVKTALTSKEKVKMHKVITCFADIPMESHVDKSNGFPTQGLASPHPSPRFSCIVAGHSSPQTFLLSSRTQERLNASLLKLLGSQFHLSNCPPSSELNLAQVRILFTYSWTNKT